MKFIIYFLLFLFHNSFLFSQRSPQLTSVDPIDINYGLVMGISYYANIRHLLYANDDADLFENFLLKEKLCTNENVVKLIDSNATRANFFKELKKILQKCKAHDRVFIYFAGHGDVESDINDGFLLCYNAEPNNYMATDAIELSTLEKYIDAFTNKMVKVVLITDACRSGNLAGGFEGANYTISTINSKFKNAIKFLSCQPNQLSEEKNYPGGGHGVFTYHLIRGMQGLADRNNDQLINLRELDEYMDEVSNETNHKQIPKIEGDPQAIIVKYNSTIKQAIIQNKSLYVSKVLIVKNGRNVIDTIWDGNLYFKEFNKMIGQKRFYGETKQNAYELLQDAIANHQSKDMIDDMKIDLESILENEVQKWINRYISGQLAHDDSTVLSEINIEKKYIKIIKNFLGDKDLRINEFKVKSAFFEAYGICRKKDKSTFQYAIGELEKAEQIMPNQAWIMHVEAMLYLYLKNYDLGVEKELQSIHLVPTWAYAWNNLGDLYREQHKFELAENAYYNAITLDSTYYLVWNNLGWLYRILKKYDQCEKCFKNAIKLQPHFSFLWANLGNFYMSQKRFYEANTCLLKAVDLKPGIADTWNCLGFSFMWIGKYDEAKKAYKKAIEYDSTYIYIYNNLGNTFLIQ